MKIERLAEFIDLYQFSLGSIAYCIGEMRTTLEELGNEEALARAEKAKKACDRARQLQYDWDQQKKKAPLEREGAERLDNEIDNLLSGLLQTVEPFAEFEVETDKQRRARELLDQLFPEGVYPITSKQFEDQHVAVNELLDRLDDSFSKHVETLGIGDLVDRLRELNDEFGETLSGEADGVDYSEVEASFTAAQDAFHGLLVQVLADYTDDMATLNRVMEPVLEQRKRTARHMKRRGTKPEVDPETGEPVDSGESPGGAEGGGDPSEATADDADETSDSTSADVAADGGRAQEEASNESESETA